MGEVINLSEYRREKETQNIITQFLESKIDLYQTVNYFNDYCIDELNFDPSVTLGDNNSSLDALDRVYTFEFRENTEHQFFLSIFSKLLKGQLDIQNGPIVVDKLLQGFGEIYWQPQVRFQIIDRLDKTGYQRITKVTFQEMPTTS